MSRSRWKRIPGTCSTSPPTAREGGAALSKVLTMPADPPTALKGEMGLAKLSPGRRRSRSMTFKALGHATGTTVNDVVLTAMTGALRTYLLERDSLVDELTALSRSICDRSTSRCRASWATASASSSLALPVGIE